MDKCLAWVQQAELIFGSDLTSISDDDAMMEALSKHEQIYKEMDQRKSQIEAVLRRGRNMLDLIPFDDKSIFSERLDVLFKRWNSLSEKAFRKESTFDSFVADQESFYENLEGFLEWMQRMGLVISQDVDENVDKPEHMENLLVHQGYCKDIKDHEKMYNMLMKNGEKILECLPFERKKSFHEQLQRLREGWVGLVDIATDKEEDLIELSGVVEGESILFTSNVKRSESHSETVETEDLSKKLDVIKSRLKNLRMKTKAVGETADERMKQHLAICLQSDSEMEKIDEVIARATCLPDESEERKTINGKIEKIKKEWDEIVESLHRERSDLEKEIEVERKLDSLSSKFDEIDGSIDLAKSIPLEDLECGLENMVCFIDNNSDIQDYIMKLPEGSGVDVKMKMLSKVRKVFERADAKKDQIRNEIEKQRKRDLLMSEIDQLTLSVAMLNEPRSADDNEDGKEDILTVLSRSVKLCLELTEKTLMLKSQVPENSREGGLKVYEDKLVEIESVLANEKEKRENELADYRISKEMSDSLNKQIKELKYEEKLACWIMTVSSAMTAVDFDDVLNDVHGFMKKLELAMGKESEFEERCVEQTEDDVRKVMNMLKAYESELQSFMESTEEVKFVYEHLGVMQEKIMAFKRNLLLPLNVRDPNESLEVFTHNKKEITEDIRRLKLTVQEIQLKTPETVITELNTIVENKLAFAVETSESMLVELDEIEASLELRKSCRLIEDDLCQLQFHSTLSLKESKDYVERYMAKVEGFESDLAQMEKSTEEEGSRELIADVYGKCRKCKDMLTKRMALISQGISQKSVFYDAVQKCEDFAVSFDDGKIRGRTMEELHEKMQNVKQDFHKYLEIVKSEDTIQQVSKLSEIDSQDMLKVQSIAIEKSVRASQKLEDAEISVNSFIKVLNLIRDEMQKSKVKKLDEFSCIAEAQKTLKEKKLMEERMKSKFVSFWDSFNAMEGLLDDTELKNISNQVLDNEKELENLMVINACLVDELMAGEKQRKDFEMCNDEICENLKNCKQQFDLDLDSSKTLEGLNYVFEEFLHTIAVAELKLGSLSSKFSASCLPSKEKDELALKLKESKSSVTSAKAHLENWREKVKGWTDSLEEGNTAVHNVGQWMDKLECFLDNDVSKNLEKELQDLEEIEKELDGIGNEVSQICRSSAATGI